MPTNWRPDILRQHPISEDIKLYCVQYMENETHSFAYTRAVLRELDFGARMEIEKLGGNKGLITILDRLRIEAGDEVVVWFSIYLVSGHWVKGITLFKNKKTSQDLRAASIFLGKRHNPLSYHRILPIDLASARSSMGYEKADPLMREIELVSFEVTISCINLCK